MNDTLNKYAATLTTWEGESEEILYRLPPLRELPDYMDKLHDESKLMGFISGKEPGYFDKFTDDSIYAALDKVGEQMDPRIAAWIKRQAAKLDRIRRQKQELGVPPNGGTESRPK